MNNRIIPPLLLLLLAAVLLFFGLGWLGLTDRDEGSNAEAAREMIETGDWVTPTLNGEPRFAKPVMIYWLMSSAYRLMGVSEFSARFPSALFMVFLVLLQYGFLARTRNAAIALFGSTILLLNIEMIAIGRMALTDSVLIFFTTLSLYSFWLGLHGGTQWRHAFWFYYIAMAVGMLTKGPIGIVVPLLGSIPYLIITRRWSQFWRNGYPLLGLVVFAMIALPWYGVMLWIHGARYTASAQADTVGRFFHIIGGHGGTLFFYIPILLLGLFPWSGFLPAALWQTWREWRKRERLSSPAIISYSDPRELDLFAALWLVGVFIFFSLSATRLPHYIGPLYPAAAILIASFWHRCLREPETKGIRLSLWMLMILGCILGLALIASPILYSVFIDQITKEFPVARSVEPGFGPVAAGFVLIIGVGIVGYFGLSEQRRPGAFWVAGLTIAIVLLIAIGLTLPHFSKYFIDPPHELAYIAGVNLQPREPLVVYGPPKPSMLFYARRQAVMIKRGEEENMKRYLKGEGRTMILLPSRLKAELPVETAGFSPIIERYGYSLLANEPMIKLPPKAANPSGLPPNPHGL